MPKKNIGVSKVDMIKDFMSTNLEWRELITILGEHPMDILKDSGYSYKEIKKILRCSLGTISYRYGTGQKDKTKSRNLVRKEKRDLGVKIYKETIGCQKCDRDLFSYQLEFDHFRGDKVGSVSRLMRNYGKETYMSEIKEKCQVLCIFCHREETMRRTYGERYEEKIKEHQSLFKQSRDYVKSYLLGEISSKNSNKKLLEFFVRNLKEKTPCKDCKEKFPYYLMDYDHVRGEKVAEISYLLRNGDAVAVINEIRKCQLVCSLCHAVRSDKRREKKYKKY